MTLPYYARHSDTLIKLQEVVVSEAKMGGARLTGADAARRLAALRKRHPKTCPVCGGEFTGLASRIYDRPACQTRAYRERRRRRSERSN